MPTFLNRVFQRERPSKKTVVTAIEEVPRQTRWEDGWARSEVAPEEIQELLRGCTHEIKLRGLSTPFLLLPYRPDADANAARHLIRTFFNPQNGELTGTRLQQELRLSETDVLCSALKWCWSRLPGGVVGWNVYELFRQGEKDSGMARDSFATFIPLSCESEARSKIIFDYFDLLSAIAAHGKHNGLGGMKLSRLAGWWAFEHVDTGFGFEGGYSSWAAAADATCHLFFAYLRSLSPADPSKSVSLLPTSLRALLASVEYPPVTPPQLQTRSIRVALTVDKIAPSPFALLRRAKKHNYDAGNTALRMFTEYNDPMDALSEECKRVLNCISSNGHSRTRFKTAKAQEPSWAKFEDLGFSGLMDSDESDIDENGLPSPSYNRRQLSPQPRSSGSREDALDIARPTTPSWADFLDAGFGGSEVDNTPGPILLPPDKILPPIDTHDRAKTSASNRRITDGSDLEPGELESVTMIDIDDAFWWVWMSSLAGEETIARKAVFGRCALVETTFKGSKWLVVEEKVRGAPKIEELPIKKDKKLINLKKLRRKSLNKRVDAATTEEPMQQVNASMPSFNRAIIAPTQAAKIHAAAAALKRRELGGTSELTHPRETARDTAPADRTNSIFTLQPMVLSEASEAMKWASRYDRDALREAYLQGKPAPDSPASESRPASIQTRRSERVRSMIEPDDEPVPMTEKALEQKSQTEPEAVRSPAISSDGAVDSIPSSRAASPAPRSMIPADVPAHPLPKSKPSSPLPLSPATSTNGRPSVNDKRASQNSQSDILQSYATKTDKPKVSRLRALFGAKEQTNGNSLSVPSSGGIGRSLSRRRKQASSPQPASPPKSAVQTAAPIQTPVSPPKSAPAPAPAKVMASQPIYQPKPTPSPPTAAQQEAAQIEFSRFDQGPLEDQPAFVPESSPDISPDISPEPSTRSPTPLAPTPPKIDTDVKQEPTKDAAPVEQQDPVSPVSPASPATPVSPVVLDRWAQIRKNAAERAKKSPQQPSDIHRGSPDADEISGEESIEARVARIKARVAAINGLPQNP